MIKTKHKANQNKHKQNKTNKAHKRKTTTKYRIILHYTHTHTN